MTISGVDMADATNDLKVVRKSSPRASRPATTGIGSMDIVEVMKRMSIAAGIDPADFDDNLAREYVEQQNQLTGGNPATKDSEENGVREMNELLVSLGMKPNAEEMLRKDPMGLMKLIMGEGNGGIGRIMPPVEEEDEETKERRQKKNKARNAKRKVKKAEVNDSADGNAGA